MALRYKCPECGNQIVTKFLKIGETAPCSSCGGNVVVPGDAEAVEISEEQYKALLAADDEQEPDSVTELTVDCPGCGETLDLPASIEKDGAFECPDCGRTARLHSVISGGSRAAVVILLLIAAVPALGAASADPGNPNLLTIVSAMLCVVSAVRWLAAKRPGGHAKITAIPLILTVLVVLINLPYSLVLGGFAIILIGIALAIQAVVSNQGTSWVIDDSSEQR